MRTTQTLLLVAGLVALAAIGVVAAQEVSQTETVDQDAGSDAGSPSSDLPADGIAHKDCPRHAGDGNQTVQARGPRHF